MLSAIGMGGVVGLKPGRSEDGEIKEDITRIVSKSVMMAAAKRAGLAQRFRRNVGFLIGEFDSREGISGSSSSDMALFLFAGTMRMHKQVSGQ